MKLNGTKKLTRHLSRMEADVKKAVSETNEEVGEDLAVKSARVCPVDETTLVSSQYDVLVESGMGVEVGYKGDAAEYMNIVHENLDPDVNWSKPGSGPKFLETPFLENRDRYARNIKNAAKKAARKGR